MKTLIMEHLEFICNLHVKLQRLNLFAVQVNSQNTLFRKFVALPPNFGSQNRTIKKSSRKSYVDFTDTMIGTSCSARWNTSRATRDLMFVVGTMGLDVVTV